MKKIQEINFLGVVESYRQWLKAIGGQRGKNTCWVHMKELLNTKCAFYGMSKFNSQLKIFVFEYGRVWRKWDFSNINLYYKNIVKNGQITIFWRQKWFQTSFLMVFHVSMVCIMQNHKKPGTQPILGNIKQKQTNFCRKWVAVFSISRKSIEVKNEMTQKPEIWPSCREK